MHTRYAALLAPLLLLAACASTPPETQNAQGDFIRFVAQNGIATANGIFHEWRVVDAKIDRGDAGASYVELEIDVASIDTGIGRRDDHLRSADFFDAERWPKATVRVSGVRPPGESGDYRYDARFEVVIRGQRESLKGDFVFVSDHPLVVEGKVGIDRVAFGVGKPDRWWNPVTARDVVPVHFRVTLQ